MRFILDLYLKSKFSFHSINVFLAIIVPVLFCLMIGVSFKEIIIESMFGLIMLFISISILGDYKSLKQGFDFYKNNK